MAALLPLLHAFLLAECPICIYTSLAHLSWVSLLAVCMSTFQMVCLYSSISLLWLGSFLILLTAIHPSSVKLNALGIAAVPAIFIIFRSYEARLLRYPVGSSSIQICCGYLSLSALVCWLTSHNGGFVWRAALGKEIICGTLSLTIYHANWSPVLVSKSCHARVLLLL